MKTLFATTILILLTCSGCLESSTDSLADFDSLKNTRPVVHMTVQDQDSASKNQKASETKLATTEAKSEKTEKTGDEKVVSTEDWTFFRGDALSTGVARTKLPNDLEELEVLWTHKVKNGAFESTPTITGGKTKTVYIGDLDGHLFALDLESGKELWKYKVEIGFITAPVVKDGRIFIGDLDGYFYCFSTDGKLLWKHETMAEINSSANFYKDKVIFGSQDTKLYCLDQKTGEVAWAHETADQVRCSATVVDNRAFVAGCDGGLHIVDLDKGEELESVDIESPTGVTPAVMGDMAYVGTEQGGFFAIDWKVAKAKWAFTPGDGISIRSCPAVTKDHVVFGAQNRTVYSLDPVTGKENWSETLLAKVDSSPVIVGNKVIVGSTDGRLTGLGLKDGEILWEKQLNGGILGSPGVAFGRVIVATDRGVVYCLGSKKQLGQDN